MSFSLNKLLRLVKKLNLKSVRWELKRRGEIRDRKATFYADLDQFKKGKDQHGGEKGLEIKRLVPLLDDKTATTSFDSHYIYHPAWAARILNETKPGFHIDISSTLQFCSIVSAFIPVKFYDYRPAALYLSNLETGSIDLLALPFEDNSILSVSCMHTVEHIGLGRYGDPIDYNGDIKAMAELSRVLAVGGSLLFVVPVGQPRIEFNAHRIYNYNYIINNFKSLKLLEFSLIGDNFEEDGMIKNAPATLADTQVWGCGCFWFTKELS